MRRIILLVLVAVLAFFGYMCVVNGIENDTLGIEISKVEQIDKDSSKLSKELNAYEEKNEKQFEAIENNLKLALKDYENAKIEYQDLVKTLGLDKIDPTGGEVVEATNKAYKIDFLFAIIGNYARAQNSTETDLDLDLVFVESTSAVAPENAGYIFADLKFTVKGDYIKIANFLYNLEDDDRLAYEIRDFAMTQKRATFTVYNVPIESSTLSGVDTGVTSSNTETNMGGMVNPGNTPSGTPTPSTGTTIPAVPNPTGTTPSATGTTPTTTGTGTTPSATPTTNTVN